MSRTIIYDNIDNSNTDMNMDMDMDMERIFLEISKNWNELEKNETVKEMVDMKTNNLCKQIKNDNPHLRNSYIQSLVFTFIYTMNINLNTKPNKMDKMDKMENLNDMDKDKN